MDYTERYFAFVDVLGFGRLIQDSQVGKVEVRAISDILKVVHKPKVSTRHTEGDVRYQSAGR